MQFTLNNHQESACHKISALKPGTGFIYFDLPYMRVTDKNMVAVNLETGSLLPISFFMGTGADVYLVKEAVFTT